MLWPGWSEACVTQKLAAKAKTNETHVKIHEIQSTERMILDNNNKIL